MSWQGWLLASIKLTTTTNTKVSQSYNSSEMSSSMPQMFLFSLMELNSFWLGCVLAVASVIAHSVYLLVFKGNE
jgi:hypothetical protein